MALLGAPNAGKSTLLNTLIGAKVSIVTPKVQTTRTRVLGICMAGPVQLVFIDTPGIFTPRRRLDRAMVAAAWQGAANADRVVVLVDAADAADGRAAADTRRIIDGLEKSGSQAILALNKIDQVKRPALLARTEALNESGLFSDTFMISALNGAGVDDLRNFLAAAAPEGPWHFPEDQLTDMPERLLAAEITREQLFLTLHQELPYSLTVETESWENFKNGAARVEQIIYVERDSQKAIVLGKGGRQIKAVGAAARQELARLLDRQIHLFMRVKVRPRWADDPERYRDLGLDYNS
ncbi:MAG: GTPase Era [Alphaproteobacteria bacterium]